MRTLKRSRRTRATTVTGVALLAIVGTTMLPAQAARAADTTTAIAALSGGERTATLPDGLGARPDSAALATLKARAAAEIARRQASLSARLTLVTHDSPHLTTADRAALTALITKNQSGLSALGRTIAADTDLATARSHRQQVFTEYRVYALALPQIRLVRASDTLTTWVLPKLTDAQTTLRSALTETGKTDQAAATMADLQTQIDAIRSATSGLSATLLAATPAQWNADRTLLQSARRSLATARQALAKARRDIQAVRTVLKA